MLAHAYALIAREIQMLYRIYKRVPLPGRGLFGPAAGRGPAQTAARLASCPRSRRCHAARCRPSRDFFKLLWTHSAPYMPSEKAPMDASAGTKDTLLLCMASSLREALSPQPSFSTSLTADFTDLVIVLSAPARAAPTAAATRVQTCVREDAHRLRAVGMAGCRGSGGSQHRVPGAAEDTAANLLPGGGASRTRIAQQLELSLKLHKKRPNARVLDAGQC